MWKESMRNIQALARDLDVLLNPISSDDPVVIIPNDTFKKTQQAIKHIRNWCAIHNVDIHDEIEEII